MIKPADLRSVTPDAACKDRFVIVDCVGVCESVCALGEWTMALLTPPTSDLSPGTVIAGRYQLDARISSGVLREVWSGRHRTTGAKLALKRLKKRSELDDMEAFIRFRREALFLGRLQSDRSAWKRLSSLAAVAAPCQ